MDTVKLLLKIQTRYTWQLHEKVDAFWRGIEGGANKRGTVSVHLIQFRTSDDDGN